MQQTMTMKQFYTLLLLLVSWSVHFYHINVLICIGFNYLFIADASIVTRLIERKAEANVRNKNGQTPRELAIAMGMLCSLLSNTIFNISISISFQVIRELWICLEYQIEVNLKRELRFCCCFFQFVFLLACTLYSNFVNALKNEIKFDDFISPRILGGTSAEEGEFPFMVRYKKISITNALQFEKYLLTMFRRLWVILIQMVLLATIVVLLLYLIHLY